jgi:hypothetical protein
MKANYTQSEGYTQHLKNEIDRLNSRFTSEPNYLSHSLLVVKWKGLEKDVIQSESSIQLLRIDNRMLKEQLETIGTATESPELDVEEPSKKRGRTDA